VTTKPDDLFVTTPLEGDAIAAAAYCNFAQVQTTAWDFRFLLSEVVTVRFPKPAMRHALRANVVMTPAHAKAFCAALVNQLREYERQFGEIAVPATDDVPSSTGEGPKVQ